MNLRALTGWSATIAALAVLLVGCSGAKTRPDTQSKENSQKTDEMNATISRLQQRVEEMDAKLSALADKVDAMRIAVDNVTGNKPLKTEAVGKQAKEQKAEAEQEAQAEPVNDRQSSADIGNFTKGMQLFRKGKYPEAELEFNRFAESYPDHILAGSAQFYAGESYFMMGEYKLALKEYEKVMSSFGSSPRVASAMVRMAHCYAATGNEKESTTTLASATDLFKGNPSLDWPAPALKNLNPTPMESEKQGQAAHE